MATDTTHLLQRLDNNGRGTTAAIADAGAANLALLLLEHTEQGRCDPGPRRSERVAQRNGTAVEVDLVFRNAQDLHVGQGNNTKRLVDLKSVDSRQLHVGVLQRLGHGEGGGRGELGGVLLSVTPSENLRNRLEAVLLDSLFRSEDKGSSPIREW